MSFDFFAASLSEMREYRSGNQYWQFLSYYLQQSGAMGRGDLIAVVANTFLNESFRSTHVTHPAESDGLKRVEETFDIKLPDDIKLFYSLWSQALLVLREAYWLMPADEILKTNLMWEYDAARGPCNLVRFARCFHNREQNFALRRKHPDAPWIIAMWDDMDYHEDDVEAGMDGLDFRVTDSSFTAWLKRMLETDGTPWFPGNGEECKTERLG